MGCNETFHFYYLKRPDGKYNVMRRIEIPKQQFLSTLFMVHDEETAKNEVEKLKAEYEKLLLDRPISEQTGKPDISPTT